MYNASQTFKMTAFSVMEGYKFCLFALFLLLYFLTVVINVVLIAVIHQNKELHQPMNVFTCMLSLNEVYGSTALLPSTMITLLSQTHEVSVQWCAAQVFFLHTYAGAEFCILALMGYDRYLAICYPLHYYSIMSNSRIRKLIVLVGLYPLVVFLCYFSLTLRLRVCGTEMPKLHCVNMELVRNACSIPPYISIVGLALLLFFVVPQVLMIVFSYAQIAKVCLRLQRASQRSAVKTCVPHLVSLLNYTIGSLFEVIQSRFDMSHMATEARIFLSLYFIIIPPVTNPVLYGLGTNLVRIHILKLFVKPKIWKSKISRAAGAQPINQST
ncbi:olfactory receptor 52D1-like [Neosynchiropus ocellatus]